jgi:SAM-dependent methyltransferase
VSDPAGAQLYDSVPYPEFSYAFTHPGRLAAIATLFGAEPPAVQTSRVLEIGCASGHNLIAMAYGLPDATFVGLDYSAAQIARARAVAEEVGVRNVEFVHADLMEVDAGLGEFDQIIAHGLYSWVPAPVQDRLLAVCNELLSSRGLAFVSFNCLPGWALLGAVRHMMMYRGRHAADPQERVRLAREQLGFLIAHVPRKEESAYHAYLTSYRESAPNHALGQQAWADAALLHDELDPHNAPVWFHEFAAHAARHGLQYLAEAAFVESMTHDLDPAAVEAVQQIAEDRIDYEQHLDFLRNRMFHRAILCREHVVLDRTLRAERVTGLSAASDAIEDEPDPERPGRVTFETSTGLAFGTEHPLSIAAFRVLLERAPESVRFGELVGRAASAVGDEPTPQDVGVVAVNLLTAFSHSTGLVDLRTDTPACTAAPGPRPVASRLARAQALASPLVTNLRQDRVELDPASAAVLVCCDGTRDRAALGAETGLTGEQVDATLGWLTEVALFEA